MAKSGTVELLKFKLLVRDLEIPRAYALGLLEMLWNSANRQFRPHFESADEVEIAADWEGEPGKLCAALVSRGWVDSDGSKFTIHDWAEHTPAWVRQRASRSGRENGGNRREPGSAKKPHKSSDDKEIEPEPTAGHICSSETLGTLCHTPSHNVTQCHTMSHHTIPYHTIPEYPNSGKGKSKRHRVNQGLQSVGLPENPATGHGGDFVPDSPEMRADRKNAKPTAVGDVIRAERNIVRFDPLVVALNRSRAFVGERTGSRQWVDLTIREISQHGALWEVEAVLDYIHDCNSPLIRKLKGLGRLKNPAGFLISRLKSVVEKLRADAADKAATHGN